MRIKSQATASRFGNDCYDESRGPENNTKPTVSSNCWFSARFSVLLALLSVAFVGSAHGFSAVPATKAASVATRTATTTTTLCSDEDVVRDQLGYLPSNYVGVSAWKTTPESSLDIRISTVVSNTTTTTEIATDGRIPVAIRTYPLNGGAKRRQNKAKLTTTHNSTNINNNTTNVDVHRNKQQSPQSKKSIVQSPFPTLFWLTCPDIARAVANLERRGFVKIFEEQLNYNPKLAKQLFDCHQEYASLRWRSLTEADRNTLVSPLSPPALKGMRNMMECSGISGTNFTDVTSWDSDYASRVANAATSAAETGPNDRAVVVARVPPIKCLHAHYAHYRSTVSLESTRHINPVGELIHKQLQLDFPDLDL